MIVGETELSGPFLKDYRKKLDQLVFDRMLACGKLDPYSEEWDLAYHEASKPIWELRDQGREHLWQKYLKLWGKNATGSYFYPTHTFNREERMSVYRVSQALANAVKELP